MKRSEAAAFFQMLTALGELFGAKLSGAAQTMYFNALRDLDLEEINEAVSNCSRKLKFMPKPAEIRENVEGYGATNILDDDADEAWKMARWGLSHYGSAGTPKDWHPDIRRSVEAAYGSWYSAAMGEFSGDVQESKRRVFIAAWKREQLDRAESERLARLALMDAEDRADGTLPPAQQKLIER
jgi:hypothetical protein